MAKPIVGLQLYTLRDMTENDFPGTLRKVAELGYQAVEFAGYFGMPASELKALLKELQLEAPSAHVGLTFDEPDQISANLAKEIDYAKELGLTYLVTPYAPLPDQPTMEDVRALAQILEAAGRQVTAAGLKYAYHNHDFELKRVEGKPVLDHLLELVPAEYMAAEFDLGWIHMGGEVPVDYVTRYAGRLPLAHFKDFGEGTRDTEVGTGVVDLKSVLAVAEQAGIQYFIVEQEEFPSSSIESAARCLDFFRENGILD
ncbi:sugar phosphate isomerase/epimerase [Gorillibacterium sp. CAU 1737]|uniref:sugar phosphate isomerase/epimerase family protein n=1 Tax=Gorillibacterium sp. CAU 1737 TaxID=3140362 RepID=UPI0032611ECB